MILVQRRCCDVVLCRCSSTRTIPAEGSSATAPHRRFDTHDKRLISLRKTDWRCRASVLSKEPFAVLSSLSRITQQALRPEATCYKHLGIVLQTLCQRCNHELATASQDISCTHLRLRLLGAHVCIADLDLSQGWASAAVTELLRITPCLIWSWKADAAAVGCPCLGPQAAQKPFRSASGGWALPLSSVEPGSIHGCCLLRSREAYCVVELEQAFQFLDQVVQPQYSSSQKSPLTNSELSRWLASSVALDSILLFPLLHMVSAFPGSSSEACVQARPLSL